MANTFPYLFMPQGTGAWNNWRAWQSAGLGLAANDDTAPGETIAPHLTKMGEFWQKMVSRQVQYLADQAGMLANHYRALGERFASTTGEGTGIASLYQGFFDNLASTYDELAGSYGEVLSLIDALPVEEFGSQQWTDQIDAINEIVGPMITSGGMDLGNWFGLGGSPFGLSPLCYGFPWFNPLWGGDPSGDGDGGDGEGDGSGDTTSGTTIEGPPPVEIFRPFRPSPANTGDGTTITGEIIDDPPPVEVFTPARRVPANVGDGGTTTGEIVEDPPALEVFPAGLDPAAAHVQGPFLMTNGDILDELPPGVSLDPGFGGCGFGNGAPDDYDPSWLTGMIGTIDPDATADQVVAAGLGASSWFGPSTGTWHHDWLGDILNGGALAGTSSIASSSLDRSAPELVNPHGTPFPASS